MSKTKELRCPVCGDLFEQDYTNKDICDKCYLEQLESEQETPPDPSDKEPDMSGADKPGDEGNR